MSEFGVKFIQFMNMNPTFKGGSVTIVGLVALLFALWMNWRWREPFRGGFLVFMGFRYLSSFSGFLSLFFSRNGGSCLTDK